ncbi:MAG: DUF3987 domain-containing protein [Planctomycetes bacterium]|nr:DUF3987 domain-containing protein [Planctomycetota bacterium]
MTPRDDLTRIRADRGLLIRALNESGADTANPAKFQCPFHPDQNPSAGIYAAEDGSQKFKCHGCDASGDVFDILQKARGCSFAEATTIAIEWAGVPVQATHADGNGGKGKTRRTFACYEAAISETLKQPGMTGASVASKWIYRNADRTEAFVSQRFNLPDGGKTFRPYYKDDNGWHFGYPDGPRPLYRLGALLEQADKTVWVCEGERCADYAAQLGLLSTTSAGGARAASKTDWQSLAGRIVNILCDNDPAGLSYGTGVAAILAGLTPPATVRVIESLPGVPEGGDIIDWGNALSEDVEAVELVEEIAAKEPVWQPARAAVPPAIVNDAPSPALPWQPMPLESLPTTLRDLAVAGGRAIGADPAGIGLASLGVCAGAIGNARVVEIKASWIEPSVLWVVLVAESGSIKSATIALAADPLRKISADARKLFVPMLADFKAALADYKAESKSKRKGDSDNLVAPPEQPICERFVIGDCTLERLARLLQENSRGLTLVRDELSAWINGFGRYNKSAAAEVGNWLEMHGAQSITVDRVVDPAGLYVPRAAVSIIGSIQPTVAARALTPDYFECGLPARLLLTSPPILPRVWNDEVIHLCILETYRKTVRRLLQLYQPTDGPPPRITFDASARARWVEYFNDFGRELGNEPDPHVRTSMRKMEGATARIALVIHLVDWAEGTQPAETITPITENVVARAVELAGWLMHETRRVYAMLGRSAEDTENDALVAFIKDRCEGRVQPRDLMRRGPCCKSIEEAKFRLQRLERAKRGVFVHQRQPGTTTGPVPEWFVLS